MNIIMIYIHKDTDLNLAFACVIPPFHLKSNLSFQVNCCKMSQKQPNLVKPRQKFSPYTKMQRKERRNEVYKLHFEHGMPATRIAELMKVDRNTINNDLKILYKKAIRNHDSDLTYDEVIEKYLVRLENQRD